jgi:hypothetical protein
MNTWKFIESLTDKDLILVTDSQDVNSIKDYLGYKNSRSISFDSYFVKIIDGDYSEIWGFMGMIPYNDKVAFKVK